MSEQYHIVDMPLSLGQDFRHLKDRGIVYLQQHSGLEWNNYNASDPGITILDQICFALTELGYCNDFPIEDILTAYDGKLRTEDQFYLPEYILTTASVSASDYRKYLIDGVDDVDNVVVLKDIDLPKTYRVYLLIEKTAANEINICNAAFVYINQSRNLGENFLVPQILIAKPVLLSGKITIESNASTETVLQLINTAIRNYIFPAVSPQGYKKLVEDSEITDEIFDGPRLKNGWISTEMLGEKKDHITISEITSLIENVPGVESVANLFFVLPHPEKQNIKPEYLEKFKCKHDQVLVVDLIDSCKSKYLGIFRNYEKEELKSSVSFEKSAGFETNILLGSSVEIQSDLPKGEYRDINSYYSIQNTFPEIFGVGADSVTSNATPLQIAQSRQLKGYLTLIDQVLANQFSQLANIDRLFSFKNAMTSAPSDREKYFAVKDHYEKKNQTYPVPYVRFSPTYFFQSLYHIPDIKPLLKGNESFDFSIEQKPAPAMTKMDWRKYRFDPYNPYIRGVMEMMEDENTSLFRRNEMLDHLLARHGESPLLIDTYINGSFYTRERNKDKVIFKSLYLQNLGLLSYNRYKAFNYLQAEMLVNFDGKILPIKTSPNNEPEETLTPSEEEERFPELKHIVSEFEKWIFGGHAGDFAALENFILYKPSSASIRLEKWILEGNTVDSIFNSEKVNELERLTENDFKNYSGIELKLSLLFGIKILYRDFLTGSVLLKDEDQSTEEIVIPADPYLQKLFALWFILERKGFIMVEMPLLFAAVEFNITLLQKEKNDLTTWNFPNEKVGKWSYETIRKIAHGLSEMKKNVLDKETHKGEIVIDGNKYSLSPPTNIPKLTSTFHNISETNYYFQINVLEADGWSFPCPDFFSDLVFLFPDFISGFIVPEFGQRLNFFLRNELPVNTRYRLKQANDDLLDKLIPAFVTWHNSLIPKDVNNYSIKRSRTAAVALLKEISQTIPLTGA